MAKPQVGKYGVFGAYEYFKGRAAAIEQLGYGAIWVGGSPPSDLAWLEAALAESERIVVASGIVNVWTAPAGEVAATYHRFEERYPGRFLLGVGAGHPEIQQQYQSPYQKVVSYLDELDANGVPKERIVLAALRGNMQRLAAERTAGSHPYFMPVAQTRFAREALGPGPLLATEAKIVFETDPAKAHEAGAAAAKMYLGLANYLCERLARVRFPRPQGRRRGEYLDALVQYGTPEKIAAGLQQLFDAGADHVAVQVVPSGPTRFPGWPRWRRPLGLA